MVHIIFCVVYKGSAAIKVEADGTYSEIDRVSQNTQQVTYVVM